MAKPEETQAPTRNLRDFYQDQPPIVDTLRSGAQGVIQGVANGGRIGLPSKFDAAARMLPAPVANAIDTGMLIAKGLRRPNTPAISSAVAAPTPAAAKQPVVQQPAGSKLGLPSVSTEQLWNTKLNQTDAQTAPAGNVRSRPTVTGAAKTQPQPKTTAPAAPAAPAAQPAADDSVIIDRGLGRPGSTFAMIDNETGQILTAAGGTDTYRPFEGEYVTQGRQDEITANRLNIGDPMTAGQAGAISKQAALLTDRALAEAGDTQRTGMTVEGGIAQQRISTGGAITQANIAHGEANKLKAMEAKAIAALDDAIKSGDAGAIGLAQQRLNAIRGGTAATAYAPLTVYDEAGQPSKQILYNKQNPADIVDPSNTGLRHTPRSEYDALRPGAEYVGPDGKRYIKGE